jgi:hypothetical protein
VSTPARKRATRPGTDVLPVGPRTIPGTWLETLAVDMKFTRFEWRVVAVVLARQPVTAWQVARILKVNYSHAKRAARELVRWKILNPSPEGLRFQQNPRLWGPAMAPGVPRNGSTKPSKKPSAPAEPREVIFTEPPAPRPAVQREPPAGFRRREVPAVHLAPGEVIL